MDRRYEVRLKELLGECRVDPWVFEGLVPRLQDFVRPFADCLGNSQQRKHLEIFVSGLTSNLERKNSESIAYHFDRDRQALQRFIGSVPWDHRPMLMELTRQVATELGEPDGVIVFDPSAVSKSGHDSVGVAPQWNGREGKVDNSQVGIYMGYVSRREHALVDTRLFLTQARAKDKQHRKKCRVPQEVRFQTRLDLALDMLTEKGSLLPHAWIAGDDEFGRSTQFRRDLRGMNEQYLLAVPSNTLIRDLEAEPPLYRGRGIRPKSPYVRVKDWCAALGEDAWTRIDVRDGAKGPLIVHVVATRVLAITERTHLEAEEMLVVVRRLDEEGKTIYDYYLSNAPPGTRLLEFARVAKAEHRIEECFQRAKSEAGLADYETRTWWGWHHHQTLSLLASWFLVQETWRGKKIHTRSHVAADTLRVGHYAIPRFWTARRGAPHAGLPTTSSPQRTGSLLPAQEKATLGAIAC